MRGVSNDVPWRGQGDVIRNRVTGSGKGDKRRPAEVPRATYESEFDRIFGKRDKPETNDKK